MVLFRLSLVNCRSVMCLVIVQLFCLAGRPLIFWVDVEWGVEGIGKHFHLIMYYGQNDSGVCKKNSITFFSIFFV